MKPTCTSFLPSSTSASTTSRAASALSARGFSQSTGFPRLRHSFTRGAWVGSGEAITTASTFSSRIIPTASPKTSAPLLSATLPARSLSRSATAANLAFATSVWRMPACNPPMPPVPTTPTAIRSDFLTYSSFYLPNLRRHPSPALHAPFDGIQHRLAAVAVLEGRPRVLAGPYSVQKVLDGVHEGVLVADGVSRRPPSRHVQMLGLGYQDRTEPGRLLVFKMH